MVQRGLWMVLDHIRNDVCSLAADILKYRHCAFSFLQRTLHTCKKTQWMQQICACKCKTWSHKNHWSWNCYKTIKAKSKENTCSLISYYTMVNNKATLLCTLQTSCFFHLLLWGWAEVGTEGKVRGKRKKYVLFGTTSFSLTIRTWSDLVGRVVQGHPYKRTYSMLHFNLSPQIPINAVTYCQVSCNSMSITMCSVIWIFNWKPQHIMKRKQNL